MATKATVLFTGITYKTHPDHKDEKIAKSIMSARKGQTVELHDSEFERLHALGAVAKSATQAAEQATTEAKAETKTPAPAAERKVDTPDDSTTKRSTTKRSTGKRASRRASRAKK